jgi:ornithine decarboxylase
MIHLNDGVYGTFMNVIMKMETMQPSLITSHPHLHVETVKRQQGEYRYSIWGPTCDGMDWVARDTVLESEVKVGDWLKYKNMGGEHSFTLWFFP